MVDKVFKIPLSEIDTVTEAELNGFAQVLSSVPPDPRIFGILGTESDWTLYDPSSPNRPFHLSIP